MKYVPIILVVFFCFVFADVFGARLISRNTVSQHVRFSTRADRYPDVWPFELFLSPVHKL
jgi:hypothetical protein